MATIQTKLDKLITAVEKITKRLDNFDDKFGTLNERLNQLENKLERKYVKLEENLEAELIEVTKRLRILEEFRIDTGILEEFRIDTGKAALMQESYNKRMNILIHGVEENEENVWENHQQTLQKFDNFLKEALHIDPKNVEVADIHRLPQKPVIRRGVKVTRPIIVKLTNAMSKAKIFSRLTLIVLKHLTRPAKGMERGQCMSQSTYLGSFSSGKSYFYLCSNKPKQIRRRLPGGSKMENMHFTLITKKFNCKLAILLIVDHHPFRI